jgi:hypothetical protein
MLLEEFLSSDAPVVDFEFIDTRAIESYYEQVRSNIERLRKNTKYKIEFSVPFVKASVETQAATESSFYPKLKTLLHELNKSEKIIDGFPASKSSVAGDLFYFSSGRGTRYRLPKERLSKFEYNSDVFMWLIKQEFGKGEQAKPLETIGNVMYLLERPDLGEKYSAHTSLYSATQFLMEELGVISTEGDPRSVVAYADSRSPEVVLEEIGAERHARRKVAACYRCRSMSDNMYILINGVNKRFNDIVAYPLFIVSL